MKAMRIGSVFAYDILMLAEREWGKLIGTKIFKPDASGKVSPLGS
jgi:hypothetical protein